MSICLKSVFVSQPVEQTSEKTSEFTQPISCLFSKVTHSVTQSDTNFWLQRLLDWFSFFHNNEKKQITHLFIYLGQNQERGGKRQDVYGREISDATWDVCVLLLLLLSRCLELAEEENDWQAGMDQPECGKQWMYQFFRYSGAIVSQKHNWKMHKESIKVFWIRPLSTKWEHYFLYSANVSELNTYSTIQLCKLLHLDFLSKDQFTLHLDFRFHYSRYSIATQVTPCHVTAFLSQCYVLHLYFIHMFSCKDFW